MAGVLSVGQSTLLWSLHGERAFRNLSLPDRRESRSTNIEWHFSSANSGAAERM